MKTNRRTFPTLDHVWIAAALALIALRPLVVPIPPHDFWWHMGTGRLIVQTGEVPTVDSFSYTQAGEEFYNQGWLAQVFLYGLHSLGGVPLILVAQALVIVMAYGLLLWLCIQRSGAVRLSVGLLLLTVLVSFDNWNVRPQSYALPLFAAYLVILTAWRTGQRIGPFKPGMLWLLPLLMVVWVNLHGSFVLGGALIAMTFVGTWMQRRGKPASASSEGAAPTTDAAAQPSLRNLFLWGVATAAAMLLNPRGFDVIGYVLGLLSTSAVTNLVEEWTAPTIRTFTGSLFFLFVLVLVAVLAYAPRPPDLVDMLLAGAFFWLALGAERNIIWFAMIVTPLLVVQTAALRSPQSGTATRRPFQGVPAMNGLLIGLLLLLLLLGLPWVKPALGLPPQIGSLLSPDTPVAAVDAMQSEPQTPEHLFHTIGYGSYLIWAAPDQPVFIDTRIELYPVEQWRDYLALNAGTNAETLLAKYEIDGLLLDNQSQEALLERVRDDPAWTIHYEDEQSTYLTRR